jgi:tetratricopeptide (TPR) repeat protein
MNKWFIFLIITLVFILFLSCQTRAQPIIYDHNIEKIDKEKQLIHFLIQNDNFEEAEKYIENTLKLYDNSEDILHLKAWYYLKQNHTDESEAIFLSLLKKNQKNPLVIAGLARINRLRGDKKKALAYIESGMAKMPTFSIFWFEKGMIEYDENLYKKALTDFNQAYILDNKNEDIYFFKFLTLIQLEKNLDEIKFYWDNLTRNKHLKNWYFDRYATLLYKIKESDQAMKIIQEGLNNYPDDPYLLNNYATFLYDTYLQNNDRNLLTDAKDHIVKCIETVKNPVPEFIDTYFNVLEKNGEIELLKKEAEKYFLLFPSAALMIEWVKKMRNL